MPITLRQLEIFSAVAKYSSISKAAKSLGLSQPAVSKQIQQMEKHLGVPVVDIIRQRVHITDMGLKVLGHARRFDEVLNDLNNTVCDADEELTGDLRVGVGTSLGSVAVHYYAKFLKQNEKVALRMNVSHRELLLNMLLENKIDLILSPRKYQIENLTYTPLRNFNYVIVANKKNPLSNKKRIAMNDLADQRFVRYLKNWFEGDLLYDLFTDNPDISCVDIDNIEVVRAAIQDNVGIALLPDYMLEKDARNIVKLDVVGLPIKSKVHLVHLKNKKLTKTAQAFKEYLVENFK